MCIRDSAYGAALFFATPFAIGVITALRARKLGACSLRQVFAISSLSIIVIGAALLLFAFEGVICLVMALPLAGVVALFGAFFGYHFAPRRNRLPLGGAPLGAFCLIALCALEPLSFSATERVFEVRSSIDISAPPEEVWNHVVGFSEIPDTPGWALRMGIAYPVRARIEGSGVGAVRHCEFSTGPFVEPITVWDPPNVLGFSVQSQPPPMTEISPYRNLHPPHLDGTIRSQRGEFRLTRLATSVKYPRGGTHLEGSTWYTLKIYPQGYWRLWADLAIHTIHNRVLRHVRNLAEGGGAKSSQINRLDALLSAGGRPPEG